MKIYEVYATDDWNTRIDALITLDETKAKEYGLEIYHDVHFVMMDVWQDEEIIEEYYIDIIKGQWVKSEHTIIEEEASEEDEETVRYVIKTPEFLKDGAIIPSLNLKEIFCECKSLPVRPIEE